MTSPTPVPAAFARLAPLGRRQVWLARAALAAPAAAVFGHHAQHLLRHRELSAGAGFDGVVALAWIALASTRPLPLDCARFLLARLPWIAWFLLAAATTGAALFASLGPAWFGAAAGLWLTTGLAMALARAAAPRRFALQATLLVANLGLLVAADLLVGWLVVPRLSHNKLFVQHDALLGWRLRPGPAVQRSNSAYTSLETVNALGFRTPEVPFAKPAGTRRILVLGDSHAEGYTVDDDQTCPRLLERHLRADGPLEVISLGVGGYSTDQEYLAYLELGRRYQPDVVLLLFCENDVPFNAADRYWRGRKPRFQAYGDTLLLQGVPVPDERGSGLFSPDLLQHSALVVVLEGALRNLAVRKDHEAESRAAGWPVTRLLLRDLARAVQQDGARFAVANVNAADPGLDGEDRQLRAVLAEFGIPYLATAQAYTEPFASYWVAGHWNQAGHRAVAQVLTEPLRALLGTAPAAGR
jgi:lysophospholipase L1-like esterase